MSKRPTKARSYLAENVEKLSTDVSALAITVAKMDVTVATLLEQFRRGEVSASGYRQNVRSELQALRDEQSQLNMSITNAQADISTIKKTVSEHETERQQVKGAATLAKSISGAGWGMVGLLTGAILTAVGFIARHFAGGSPPPHVGSS